MARCIARRESPPARRATKGPKAVPMPRAA
jgi:hypothetical protein